MTGTARAEQNPAYTPAAFFKILLIVISNYFEIVRKFVLEDIWRFRKDTTSKKQFWFIRTSRIFILAIRRFISDDCIVKASALTFYSLLSVVPVFALVFAIAKGFGFLDTLEAEIQRQFIGHDEVVRWIQEFALSYLENTRGGMLAGVGVVVLIWSVMRILSNIEESFNDIWDVKSSRSFARKFSDYISFVIVATLLLILSSSIIVFITNSIEFLNLGSVATPIITWATPYIIIWVVFTLMFMIMPNTKVKTSSAVFGGIISGTLFLMLQFGYIYFQVGMSKYNAIYGSFAALPLFLIWLQFSWMIVLLGAQLSYAHQNERSFEFETDTREMSDYYRRLVSLLIVKCVVQRFKSEGHAPSMSDLSVSLKLPTRLVSEVLRKLIHAGLLVEVLQSNTENDICYQPAFDTEKMTVYCIIDKLENDGTSDFHFEETNDFNSVRSVLENIKRQQSQMSENKPIAEL